MRKGISRWLLKIPFVLLGITFVQKGIPRWLLKIPFVLLGVTFVQKGISRWLLKIPFVLLGITFMQKGISRWLLKIPFVLLGITFMRKGISRWLLKIPFVLLGIIPQPISLIGRFDAGLVEPCRSSTGLTCRLSIGYVEGLVTLSASSMLSTGSVEGRKFANLQIRESANK